MLRKDESDYRIFRQVFNENREILERLAYYSVRDRETAKDIVSGAFLKVWEARGTLDMDRVLPYIFVTVKNSCLNYRRDSATHRDAYERIRQREQSAMDFYTRAIESCNPADLFREDILNICRNRLGRMSPSERFIYLKSRVDGLTYKEIAKLLDIPVKKVDNSMQNVLKDLRKALADYLKVLILLMLSSM